MNKTLLTIGALLLVLTFAVPAFAHHTKDHIIVGDSQQEKEKQATTKEGK